MSAFTTELHRIAEELRAEGHHLAGRLHDAITGLHHAEAKVAAEATADGKQLAADAEHAATPLAAEAKSDAEHLATDAVTAITEPAPAQPPAAPSA